ncbi:DNA recombination protein RmuC [Lipingzhangella sp. LS1_29]|uniref:DNA recombination protein RmuC n=1 Tax=Lipingzhangella rawalii TaxID=2055835 RepID=A0ABU2HB98_9ACTN|nr:DNA recombination protein RmuC [Lipingzhangella rawalii]MDS1272124.1 DNA recombination protein RmuC [Lipingzhangella rawalii]
MDVLYVILVLLVGIAIGVLLGWLIARGQSAEARADARAAREHASYVEEQLTERFRALSNEALDANHQRLVELAEGRLRAAGQEARSDLEQRRQAVEHMVTPLRETLSRVENQLREGDAGRRAAHAELAKQVELMRQGSSELREQTQALVTALRRPEARGRWGELQLRRVAELAGMSAYCDFDEQVTAEGANGTLRPDMVVRLAGGKNIVVDSKVSLAAYLEAVECEDPDARNERLAAHAKHLRQHVDALARKSYWAALQPTPEFVVLFVPGEAFLAPALEHDGDLLEHAMAHRVHIATPTTLISLLRTAQYAWQQEALSENARAVFELGKQLHDRLSTLGEHVQGLGKSLSRTVAAYNKTVGSLESRVLVTARRFNDLQLVEEELDEPSGVTDSPRPVTAPELEDTQEDAEDTAGQRHQDGRSELFGAALGNGPGSTDADAGTPDTPDTDARAGTDTATTSDGAPGSASMESDGDTAGTETAFRPR